MERTPPPQFNQWSQRRKRRGGGNNTSCCTPFLPTLTAIHNKPKQPDRTRKEREREKRHQTHMIDAPGWGDQCLVWAPNRQAMLHTWIYTPSPPLIVSGGGLSANGGGDVNHYHSYHLAGSRRCLNLPSGIPGPRRWKASVRTCECMFREDAEDEGMTTTPQGNVTTFVLQVGG